jgi:hypothetical protein
MMFDSQHSFVATRILVVVAGLCLLSASLTRANPHNTQPDRAKPHTAANIHITNLATSPGLPGVMVVDRKTNGQQLPLLYTTDGGLTWNQLLNAPWNHVDMIAIAPRPDPQFPARLLVVENEAHWAFIATKSDKVTLFRSGDWGQSWATEVISQTNITALAVSPLNANSLTRVESSFGPLCVEMDCIPYDHNRLSRSLNGGGNWTPLAIESWLPFQQLVLSPVVAGEGYYKDGYGYDWYQLSTGQIVSFTLVLQLTLDASYPDRLYGVGKATQGEDLPFITVGQTSANRGSTWNRWTTLPASDCTSLTAHPTKSNLIYLVCDSGLYFSPDAGGQ